MEQQASLANHILKQTVNMAAQSMKCRHQAVVNHLAACSPETVAMSAVHVSRPVKLYTDSCHSLAA